MKVRCLFNKMPLTLTVSEDVTYLKCIKVKDNFPFILIINNNLTL